MDDKLKILLCEDDENLGTLLSEYLQAKGYQADLCPDGEVGYKFFLKNKYDICVLDVMMPKKDGFTLAQEIRQANAEIPIIFLTAKQLKEDILEGFKIGADDYITKPFEMPILVAKIQGLFRRAYEFVGTQDWIEYKGATLHLKTTQFTYNQQAIDLTKNEFQILRVLFERVGSYVSRDELMKELWNSDFFIDDNTLTVNVARLRKKLEECGLANFITTKKGIGYGLVDSNE